MYTRAKPVSLPDVLAAKEARAGRQSRLLREYGLPLVSFSLNLAGEYKRFPLSDLLFSYAIEKLKQSLGEAEHVETVSEATGLEALLVYNLPADAIKRRTLELEESLPAGRLLDLDVLDPSGHKLERNIPRGCIICGQPASICSRSRAHGLEAITNRTEVLLRHAAVEILSDYAVDSLLEEVRLTPKPGLVDLHDNGAHSDMNPGLFEISAQSLRPYFRTAAALGMEDADCMVRLQKEGIEAEKSMLIATGGVNTHKGAVYAFGLALAAAGSCLVREDNLFLRAGALAKAGEQSDVKSHGALLREEGFRGGARAEAERGFPTAQSGLSFLEKGDEISALMEILLICRDSNLLWRGGEAGLQFTREYAARVLAAEKADRPAILEEMNREMVARRLSPGGSADILALSMFLKKLKGVIL